MALSVLSKQFCVRRPRKVTMGQAGLVLGVSQLVQQSPASLTLPSAGG